MDQYYKKTSKKQTMQANGPDKTLRAPAKRQNGKSMITKTNY